MYLSRHRKEIIREAGGRNYFIHRSLGGCGATLPFDWDWTTSAHQRSVALDKAFKVGGAGSTPGSLARLVFKVYGPREAPGVPDLFSRDHAPWVAPQVAEPPGPFRWPLVLDRAGRRSKFLPSSMYLSKLHMISGVESSCTTREF